MLNSLKIENFRSLEDFQVKKLGRINLIVGKNNSGKSSVLEALRIYAGNASRELLENIAQGHDEKYGLTDEELDTYDAVLPFEDLFTGRKFPDDNRKIAIGELEKTGKDLEISSVFLVEKEQIVVDTETGEEGIRMRRISVDKTSLSDDSDAVGEALLITKEKNLFVLILMEIKRALEHF